MSKPNIRPLHDRVVVKRLAEEEKTAGGIIIPDTAKEKPTEGEVIACGKGAIMNDGSIRQMDVQEGDRILFKKWGAEEVKLGGEDFLILKEDDIIAVVQQ